MEYEIKITGSGPTKDLIDALKDVISEMEKHQHERAIEDFGECEWEDMFLMTTIEEYAGDENDIVADIIT